MSIQPTTLKGSGEDDGAAGPIPQQLHWRSFNKARLAWGHFLAFQLEGDREEKVFSTQGVIEALTRPSPRFKRRRICRSAWRNSSKER